MHPLSEHQKRLWAQAGGLLRAYLEPTAPVTAQPTAILHIAPPAESVAPVTELPAVAPAIFESPDLHIQPEIDWVQPTAILAEPEVAMHLANGDPASEILATIAEAPAAQVEDLSEVIAPEREQSIAAEQIDTVEGDWVSAPQVQPIEAVESIEQIEGIEQLEAVDASAPPVSSTAGIIRVGSIEAAREQELEKAQSLPPQIELPPARPHFEEKPDWRDFEDAPARSFFGSISWDKAGAGSDLAAPARIPASRLSAFPPPAALPTERQVEAFQAGAFFGAMIPWRKRGEKPATSTAPALAQDHTHVSGAIPSLSSIMATATATALRAAQKAKTKQPDTASAFFSNLNWQRKAAA